MANEGVGDFSAPSSGKAIHVVANFDCVGCASVVDGSFLERIKLPHSILRNEPSGMYHTIGSEELGLVLQP
jgi:hypothetical protein